MFHVLSKELVYLKGFNKIITYLMISLSVLALLGGSTICSIPQIHSIKTLDTAFNLIVLSTMLFLLGITIGILLNQIAKRNSNLK